MRARQDLQFSFYPVTYFQQPICGSGNNVQELILSIPRGVAGKVVNRQECKQRQPAIEALCGLAGGPSDDSPI